MRTRITQMLAALGLLALVLFAAPAATAQDTGPLTVDKQSVAAGGTVTFSGSGCVAGAQVEYRALRGDINDPEVELLGDTEADADGNFSTSLTIPAGTTPGPLEIEARCGSSATSSQTLTATIDVTAAQLAVTGRTTSLLVLAGGVVLAAGALFVATSRRITH